MRREGSPFTGLGAVYSKECADNLRSSRMLVLTLLVTLTGVGAIAASISEVKATTEQDPFLFLRLFANSKEGLPSFASLLGILIPLIAIGLGFDAINSEFNRRTLSRILSQPIYRDALLLGKFLAGLTTLAVALCGLWLLLIGGGLLVLGVPPSGEEVTRAVVFLLVSVAYGGVWLALAILLSVVFKSAATSALCGLGLWLFFAFLWPLLAPMLLQPFIPTDVLMGGGTPEQIMNLINISQTLSRLSPNTLFSEVMPSLLNPSQRSVEQMLQMQFDPRLAHRAMLGAPLPLRESLLSVWPQVTGLFAGAILVFAGTYIVFQRQEVRA